MKSSTSVETVPAQKGDDAVTVEIPFAAAYPSPDREASFNMRYLATVAETAREVQRWRFSPADAHDLASDIVNSVLMYTAFEDPCFNIWLRLRTKCRLITAVYKDPYRLRREPLPDDWDQVGTDSPDRPIEDLKERVNEVINRLSPQEAKFVELYFWQGWKRIEIAERRLLPLSHSGVKSLSVRVHAKLGRLLRHLLPLRRKLVRAERKECVAPVGDDPIEEEASQ